MKVKLRVMPYIGVDLAKSLNIIRFIISDEVLQGLAEKKVPEDIIEKVEQFKDTQVQE